MVDRLTIYTPTYNRKEEIKKLYESLCRQTNKKFIWLVIDDGSTDGTDQLISKWIYENQDFHIEYVYKNNGGVHTARDKAFEVCHTELIMGVDSDDTLVNKAVEKIYEIWNNKPNGKFAGIYAQARLMNGKKLCRDFPEVNAVSCQDFIYKYKCTGEKCTVVLSSLMKEIPNTPVFNGEKVVSESYRWIQLPEDYKFLILNEEILNKSFQLGGYTMGAYSYFFDNPRGFRATYKQYIISGKYLQTQLKGYMGYIASSLYLKDKHFIKDSPNPVLTIVLLPIGILSLLYLFFRRSQMDINKEIN